MIQEKTRPWFRFAGLLLVLAAVLLWGGQSAWAAGDNAVGENALSLTGERPPVPPGGLNFSGYVQVPYQAGLNPSGGQITIEAWVKRNVTNRNETLVGNGYHTSYWLGFSGTGRLRFFTHGNGSGVDSTAVIPAGVWTHVAVTYDGFTRRYYVNGVLDKTSTAGAGPLAPAPSGQPLGIGFDRDDDFNANYFGGAIDQMRIWKAVRSGSAIKAGMYQSYGGDPAAAAAGLLAEWRFDGDAKDATGHYNGVIKGSASYITDSAIPHDIRAPQVASAPSLDGACGSVEYAGAALVGVGGATVHILHTATDMWVCFDKLNSNNDHATLYLDANDTRVDPAQPEHLTLDVFANNTLRARAGDGSGNYTATTVADSHWDGKYSVCCGEFPSRSAEFRLDMALLGGWNHAFGLALGQYTAAALPAGEQLWPALADRTLPSTWSDGILGGTGAPRSFSGKVVYQPKDGSTPVGVPNVKVTVIGRDPNGGEAQVGSAKTGLDGNFTITSNDDFAGHRLELDAGNLPQGYQPIQAGAPAPAKVVDVRTLDYGSAPAANYTGIVFTLGDVDPFLLDVQNGPYFLIVAPQAIIDSGALRDFVDYKFRLGFQVEVASIESLNAAPGSIQLRDKIRDLEKARLQSVGSHFKYVMLVGPDNVIPFPKIYLSTTNKDGNSCKNPDQSKVNWKYSDWYYADLTSNFDSNHNGCLADGAWTKASDLAPGYVPDSGIAFKPAVAVGRLPYTKPETVRTVLQNSMLFEQSSPAFKTQALLGMSMVALKGEYYDDTTHQYQNCGGDQWGLKCVGPSSNNDRSYDVAQLGNALQKDFLNKDGFASTYFYEMQPAVAGGSGLTSPQPLSEPNMVNALVHNSFGLVHADGHGNAYGVYRYYWNKDYNNNGKVDATLSPADSAAHGNVGGEIQGNSLLTTSGLNGLSSQHGYGAIYILGACLTGDPTHTDNIGATILANGYGVGWVGGLNIVTVGSWFKADDGNIQTLTYYVAKLLLDRNLRLGDAVWQTLAQGIEKGNYGSGVVAVDLYGDPTLSYWGNPGGQSTLAAWPMQRQGPLGRSFTTLTGPGTPKVMWSYGATAPAAAALPPSPVVSKHSEVAVAHGHYVDVLIQGKLYQRLNLDATAFGTPALSADGTIYALDTQGKLYAFPYSPLCFINCQFIRYRRWTLDLGQPPQASPVIGADGFIAVAYGSSNSIVAAIRPDGVKFRQALLQGAITGGLVVDANRMIYAFTDNPTQDRWRIDFFCNGTSGTPSASCQSKSVSSLPSNAAYSTPPLITYGALYGGKADGAVVKMDTSSFAIQKTFKADSKITMGPVAGPAGQVLVGTQNGTLYSLTGDLSLRWQRAIGSVQSVPAFSLDALYVVHGDRLWAYDPFSGAPMWSRYLGKNTGSGSAAIGYGRTIYIQTSSGKIVAVGEGWIDAPYQISAKPYVITGRAGIGVQWIDAVVPVSSTNALNAAQVQGTPVGLLLQRSANGGAWENVVTLPYGTTSYSDTNVMQNVSYAYRIQVLDAAGNDSEFTTSSNVQSLPAKPHAPVLDRVDTLAADALGLAWHSPTDDVVIGYRVERSQNAGGPFSSVLLTTGETAAETDMGLAANTTYFYRVVALNPAGESTPSNAISGKTRQQILPAPQNVTVSLLAGDQIQVSWKGAPAGANAVVEVTYPGLEGYLPLATVDAAAKLIYAPGEPNSYDYRVKFVQGDAESPYALALHGATIGGAAVLQSSIYLPIVTR